MSKGRRRFGSVRRLPSGRYQVRHRDLAGREHTAPRTFAAKTDADRYLAAIETDLHRGDWRDPRLGHITFEEWAKEWMVTTVDLRPTTRSLYSYLLDKHLLPHFGDVPLARITTLNI